MCGFCAGVGKNSFLTESEGGNAAQAIALSSNTLANALISGQSWNTTVGQAATISYSFTDPYNGSAALSSAQQANTLLAMQAWSKVANVSFVQASGTADITFGFGDLSHEGANVGGIAYQSWDGSDVFSRVDIVIDDGQTDNFAAGTTGYHVMLHEIGHALGLKHPFEGAVTLGALDTNSASVMSYTGGQYGVGHSPMIVDIMAVQYMYGANTTTNAGDTIYSVNDLNGTTTIWDTGGTDTIDFSSKTTFSTIDLRSGIDYASEHETLVSSNGTSSLFSVNGTFIAEGVIIENAYGGTSNDTINGNSSANRLHGNLGLDTISGNEGNDTITGGYDFTDTQDVADIIYGNAGDDIIYGNAGDDEIFGGSGISDAAETGNDILYGGIGNDKLYGNGGNDTLVSAMGNDTLYGGAGDDHYVLTWNNGVDWILPFEGAGVDGGDVLKIFANANNSGIATAADVLARSTTDGSHTWIDLGGGNGVLVLFTGGNLAEGDILIL